MDDAAISLMCSIENVHWWYRSLRRAASRELSEAVNILDLGCGTGGMSMWLTGKTVTGADISEKALQLAAKRGLKNLVRCDAFELPFRASAFDAVTCLDLLYHKLVRDDAAVVGECARVLRPGGTLVLQVPAHMRYFGAHDRSVHGVRRYDKHRIREIVQEARLKICKIGYRNLSALLMAEAFRKRGTLKGNDLRRIPAPANAVMGVVSRLEEGITRKWPLPIGLSVWCVARKGE